MRLRMILCALDMHQRFNYCCRSRGAPRDTQRECGYCGLVQIREDSRFPWRDA